MTCTTWRCNTVDFDAINTASCPALTAFLCFCAAFVILVNHNASDNLSRLLFAQFFIGTDSLDRNTNGHQTIVLRIESLLEVHCWQKVQLP